MKFENDQLITDDGFIFNLHQSFYDSWMAASNESFRRSFQLGEEGGHSQWYPGQYIAIIAERHYRNVMGIPVSAPSPPEWQKQFRKIGEFVESRADEWIKEIGG